MFESLNYLKLSKRKNLSELIRYTYKKFRKEVITYTNKTTKFSPLNQFQLYHTTNLFIFT